MADMSLEDVIKERKISLINANNSGNFRGVNNSRRVTTSGSRTVASRPVMVVTGLGKVKIDSRLRIQPKSNTIESRLSPKTQNFRDARYKLNEIARKTDARIKIEANKKLIGNHKSLVLRQPALKPQVIRRPTVGNGSRTSRSGLIVHTADGGLITKKNIITKGSSNIIRTSKGLLKTINASEIPHRTIGLSSKTHNSEIFTRTIGNRVEKRLQTSSSGNNSGFFITTNSLQKRQSMEYDEEFEIQPTSVVKRRISSDDELDLTIAPTPVTKRLSSREDYIYDDSSHSPPQISTSLMNNLDNAPTYSIFNAATTTSVLSSDEIPKSVIRSNPDVNIVSSHFPSHRLSDLEDDDPTIFSPLQGYKVSITNLDQFVSEEDIVELFGEIGSLKRACLTRPGMAEVVYSRKGDAVRAVKEYDNRELDGRPMQCRLVNPERLEDNPETITLLSGRSLGLPKESSSLSVDRKPKHLPLTGSSPSKGLDNFDVTVIHRALFKTAVPGPVRPVKFTVKV